MEYYVFVTNACNLNCEYCSVLIKNEKHNIPKEPIYSLDELNSFINQIQIKYNDDCADIVFFGGEPTLNYSYIRTVIESQESLQEVPYKFKYMLHTNGLELGIIPDDILFRINTIMLSINYDMIPHAQLNNGYFKQIADSINIIRHKRNIPIIGRLTITENTSLYSEIALFNVMFDAIYWQIENCNSFQNYSKFYDSYCYELKLVFDLWMSYLRKGVVLNLIPFVAAINFAQQKEVPSSFCCGYNNSIIFIQTDGLCYTCAEDMTSTHNLIGSITEGITFDAFGINNTKCSLCEYVYICKGRCGRMHKEFQLEHIEEYCKLNKFMFDLIISNIKEISLIIQKYNLSLDINETMYHYTEYTP